VQPGEHVLYDVLGSRLIADQQHGQPHQVSMMLPEEARQAGDFLSACLTRLLGSHRRLLTLHGRQPANGANLTLLARCERHLVARSGT